jgi:hypothetical protein
MVTPPVPLLMGDESDVSATRREALEDYSLVRQLPDARPR